MRTRQIEKRTPKWRIGLLCAVLSAAPSAFAAEFWVSLASFESSERAERLVERARDSYYEPLSVLGSATDKGYFYRVAAGPYSSSEAAKQQMEAARAAGFDGAWVWSGTANVLPSLAGDDYLSVDDDLGDLSFDLPEYELDEEDEAVLSEQREPPPEVVDTAPAGYQLNRLRRGN